MKKSRFTVEQIIGFIRQADAGMAVSELAGQSSFSPTSFYALRAKCGGMEAEDAKRLNELGSGILSLRRLAIRRWGLRGSPSVLTLPRCRLRGEILNSEATNFRTHITLMELAVMRLRVQALRP